MAKMSKYHIEVTKQKKNSVAYWQKHPLSLSERLKQFKNLREPRLAREAKLLRSEPLQ